MQYLMTHKGEYVGHGFSKFLLIIHNQLVHLASSPDLNTREKPQTRHFEIN
jgi:hypothetical protein